MKNPKTGENLSDPQPLPENWGPIFGMSGVKDRLGDLSWLGITDRAWIEVDVPDYMVETDYKNIIDEQIAQILQETLPFVSGEINVTKKQFGDWIEYRRLISEIYLQDGYPNNVAWPAKPE